MSGNLAAEFTITKVPKEGAAGAAADLDVFRNDAGEHNYYLIGSRDYAMHDMEWLRTRAGIRRQIL